MSNQETRQRCIDELHPRPFVVNPRTGMAMCEKCNAALIKSQEVVDAMMIEQRREPVRDYSINPATGGRY